MLNLRRGLGEKVLIEDDHTVTLLTGEGRPVRLGFDLPPEGRVRHLLHRAKEEAPTAALVLAGIKTLADLLQLLGL
jgi:sRNA-binding carbon storage regulator CsrA